MFKPFTTNHRVLYAKQIKSAIERRAKSPSDRLQMIMNISGMLIMLLIIIFGMAMWRDLAEPAIDKQKEITAQGQSELEKWRIIERISSDVQDLKKEAGIVDDTNKAPY